MGNIRYGDIDQNGLDGILVYLKPSLTGDEPSDVQNYASQFSSFPHQSTINQFYTESQFESYRELGCHIANDVFKEAVGVIGNDLDRTDQLFMELARRWTPPPPDLDKNFAATSKGFADLHSGLGASYLPDVSLAPPGPIVVPGPTDLNAEIYPELAALAPSFAGRQGAVRLHNVSRMLHFMQSVWIMNNLDKQHGHHSNRGWISAFERWKVRTFFSTALGCASL